MSVRKMKAFVIEAPHRAAIRTVDYPVPGPGEVTIQVRNCGICGTDYHIYEGTFLSPYPIIPGHEFSGVVEQVGEGVSSFKIGDRVTADPTLYCGECEYCLTHRTNQCSNWGALGNTVDGAMAEYVKVPARNVVKMKMAMTFAEGAFVEPVACVVHGMNRLQIRMGERVVLFGAGAMGLQLVQAIARSGASELVVVDVSKDKLELSLRLGATRGVLAEEAQDVLSRDYPQGFDVVIDVTGIPSVIERQFRHMGPTARFLQFGVTPKNATIAVNPFDLYQKDWSLIGSMAINQTFIPALRWVQEGRIDVKPLLSGTIALEQLPDMLSKPKAADMLKVQVIIGQEE
ncbi:zinc-dependent alcohol dehydrogenase family protein [Cohnella hongkongensis]|uniref:Zinc-dependent alcohol dehydrogenase family protein n=1 Tax=Cohnella hongkongensis TaxID=178337 RepID=A0ABV9FGG8_9BACL